MRRILACGLLALTVTCTQNLSVILPPCDASSALPAASATSTVTVVAVGDIADCDGGKQMQVADLVQQMLPQAVLGLGDLAYPNGALADFTGCYEPSFGRFRTITLPVPGNHEYHTPHAGAYYAFFCGAPGESFHGYYSATLGAWHVVALNSVCGQDLDVPSEASEDFGGCGPDSPQANWLRDDLDAHPTGCTLAFWHHPLRSSSEEGPSPVMKAIWGILADHHVDLVLNGHAHAYERFDPIDGIRAITVGTGGSPLSTFSDDGKVESVLRDDSSHGALRLQLQPTGYSWEFVPIAGDSFHDEGISSCHL